MKISDFDYEKLEDGYKLLGIDTEVEDLIIPEGVVEIDEYAFSDSRITSVTLPNSLKIIGEGAFSGCELLEKINFHGTPSLSIIADEAFSGVGISEITLPKSVVIIGEGAFSECRALWKLQFECGSGLSEISADAFAYTDIYELTLPASVAHIGDSAFFECTSLERVCFDENSVLKSIDDSAFSDCVTLKKISLPEGVEKIGNDAFSGCNYLNVIDIPESVTRMGSDVFFDCACLSEIRVHRAKIPQGFSSGWNPDDVKVTLIKPQLKTNNFGNPEVEKPKSQIKTELRVSSPSAAEAPSIRTGKAASASKYTDYTCLELEALQSGGYKIVKCLDDSLEELIISPEIKEIGMEAFRFHKSLKRVVAHPDFEYIGIEAFDNCTKLSEVVLPGKEGWYYPTIAARAFNYCTSLRSFKVSNVTGSSCFSNSGLKSISFSDDYNHIRPGAFCLCSQLEEVIIPDTVTTMADNAFVDCHSLKKVRLPEALYWLPQNAFRGCISLSDINLEHVKTMEEGAFRDCASLTKVSLPKVQSLPAFAFDGCSELAEVYLPNITIIGEYAFAFCPKLKHITLSKNFKKMEHNSLPLGTIETITVEGMDRNSFYAGLDTVSKATFSKHINKFRFI